MRTSNWPSRRMVIRNPESIRWIHCRVCSQFNRFPGENYGLLRIGNLSCSGIKRSNEVFYVFSHKLFDNGVDLPSSVITYKMSVRTWSHPLLCHSNLRDGSAGRLLLSAVDMMTDLKARYAETEMIFLHQTAWTAGDGGVPVPTTIWQGVERHYNILLI